MTNKNIAIVALVLLVNLVAWALANRPYHEVPWSGGAIKGLSFSPYQPEQDPLAGKYPSAQDIESDIRFLTGKTNKIRTYSSFDGIEAVPGIAAKYNMAVTAGAWLDKRRARNDSEIDNLIYNANHYRNIDRVIVGNESVLRGDLSPAELTAYIKRVKKAVKVPVSTAEPWHVWLHNPELAKSVDFIAIHVLPYWEGLTVDDSMQFLLERYDQVRKAFPGKPILIAEAGWPSGGNRVEGSRANTVNEGRFIRQFLNVADRRGIDYFIMEAFDQPWKTSIEGEAGAHWGVFSADRAEKFPMTGPLIANPLWRVQASFAALLALLPIVWFLRTWGRFATRAQIFYAFLIQAGASLLAWTFFIPATQDLNLVAQIAWGVLLPAQMALLIVMLVNGFEFAEMNWTRQFVRRFPTLLAIHNEPAPKVSLHLAICKEPPELVILTLNSLAALDYANFEVLVIDNNTDDEKLWRPVADHCAKLGPRFRFYTLGKYPGFKAGALNFALRETAPDAEIVGVVDSDYIVRPDWLRAMVPHFKGGRVGFVQAPQDHRDWEHNRFEEMLNWEYAGFFHIGMVHRNERDAIIQHGTMTLIRKDALQTLGGWSEWCICEDAELGLRLFKAGYESVYVNEPFGRGLTPHTFSGYKGQRFRWVYGAVQILRHHWRSLLPWAKDGLTIGQRYHFASGWLPWFADAMHLVFTMMAIFWTLGLVAVPKYFQFPLAAFLLPTVVMVGYKIVNTLWLYRSRVPCTFKQSLMAAVAGMSLTHVIARGIFMGLSTSSQPFLRTPKAEDKPALIRGFTMAREETFLLGGLWVAALGLGAMYGFSNEDAVLWEIVLAVQSLPYMAAVYCSFVNVLPTRAARPVTAPVTAVLEPPVVPVTAFANKEATSRKAA